MTHQNYIIRISIFILGLFIMAMGVALSVKADLGVSPISAIPYVLSLSSGLSLGQFTIIFNALLILFQVILLRKKFSPFQLVQLPVVFLFGFFIDFTLFLISDFYLTSYVWKVLLCLGSCVVLGFGVFLEVKAGISWLPGEGLAMAVSNTFGIDFAHTKTGTDCTMVVTGIIISFLLHREIMGIREGTVIAAVLVGAMARIFLKKLSFLESIVNSSSADPKNLSSKK